MNKDLFLDGVEFISASQAAKKIGYASDYVGQLCRDGKVTAKLIGRSWYVDYSSLLGHKKNHKTRKKNFQKNQISQPVIGKGTAFAAVPSVNKIEDKKTFFVEEKIPETLVENPISRQAEVISEPKISPIYPKFASAPIVQKKEERKQTGSLPKLLIACAVAVLFICSLSFAVVGTANPAKLAFSLFSLFSKSKPEVATQSAQNFGIVVTPDSADHAGLVQRIKGFFSDDVQVTFDQDADTGVITPVFHEGDDSQHYAFVMVPIKQTQ